MLFLEPVDYQKVNTTISLTKIWQKILQTTPDEILCEEIRNYLLQFIEKEYLKERMKFDNFSYFLIKKQQKENQTDVGIKKPETIGFIEYFKREDFYSIEEFCILDEFKNRETYNLLLKDLSDKLDLKFKLYVNKTAESEIEIFESLNYEIIKEELKYLGNNYFIEENVMEIN